MCSCRVVPKNVDSMCMWINPDSKPQHAYAPKSFQGRVLEKLKYNLKGFSKKQYIYMDFFVFNTIGI